MWILFLILVTPVTGFEKATALAGYTSYAECKSEEDRIQTAMYQAYPTETKTFYLKCLIKRKDVS